jgi:hypothetical protein
MTATLKSKQTAIATVRNNLRTLASFPTTLIFHWSLPLSEYCKELQVRQYILRRSIGASSKYRLEIPAEGLTPYPASMIIDQLEVRKSIVMGMCTVRVQAARVTG